MARRLCCAGNPLRPFVEEQMRPALHTDTDNTINFDGEYVRPEDLGKPYDMTEYERQKLRALLVPLVTAEPIPAAKPEYLQ